MVKKKTAQKKGKGSNAALIGSGIAGAAAGAALGVAAMAMTDKKNRDKAMGAVKTVSKKAAVVAGTVRKSATSLAKSASNGKAQKKTSPKPAGKKKNSASAKKAKTTKK